jgi:hypothetical protein
MNARIYHDVPFVVTNKRLSQILLESVRLTTRILIVVDDGIKLVPGHGFGISRLIDLLRSPPWWTRWRVRFDVDLAQREFGNEDPVAHHDAEGYNLNYEKFRFDMEDFNLDEYDQVWLFGLWVEDQTNALTAAEVAVLRAWMNKGGGVFATGDHGTQGAALCKDVPRVRSMRLWTSAQNPPPGLGVGSERRRDTTQPATPEQARLVPIPSNNQTDNVPQPIVYRYETFLRFEIDEGRHLKVSTVHPLLCGIGGPIEVLPDHAHEGEVEDFVDFDFGIVDPEMVDYPSVDGLRERPKVVAMVRSGRPSNLNGPWLYEGGEVDAGDFPAIGAYDGQRVGVGRVVVDSSFHHWLNLNLEGLDQAHLHQIQTYHLNVAMWLGKREHRLQAMRAAMLTSMLVYPGVVELHRRVDDFREVGRATGNILRLNVPDCEVEEFTMNPAEEEPPPLEEPIEQMPDKCLSCPPFEELAAYTLGGIVESLREVIVSYEGTGKFEDLDAIKIRNDVKAAITEGAAQGRRQFAADLRTSLKTAGAIADLVDKLSGK